MTNSPPSNVKLGSDEHVRVLASGIDTLVLAINVQWPNDQAFLNLSEHKIRAKSASKEEPVELLVSDDAASWRFNVRPHGSDGYEWLLSGKELTMKIGAWLEPKQRPSVMVELRSETLWMHGPCEAVTRVMSLIQAFGGQVLTIKPSRVDLCVDVLVAESEWRTDLIASFNTRARNIAPYLQSRELSGFMIGKGAIAARLYDKPREIRKKSHKDWMYVIWGIEAVPEGHRVIRVEYQIRRENLRNFEIHTWDDLRAKIPNLWAYCTTKWLRLVDDASLHHTQQELLPWWSIVQMGIEGAQGAEPLVRSLAIRTDKKRLSAQALGTIASIVAVELGADELAPGETLDMKSFMRMGFEEAIRMIEFDDAEFSERLRRKQAKLRRCGPGFTEGQ